MSVIIRESSGNELQMHPLLSIGVIFSCLQLGSAVSRLPNVLLIIADDLGYGDLSSFGNTSLATPNIDSIGSRGLRLTHHLAAASVCTPSRTALLTGRLPIRSGMASSRPNRVFIFLASTGGLPPTEQTIATLLKRHTRANYTTGLVGKWHLGTGNSGPLRHGFDYFYGVPLTNMRDHSTDPRESVVLAYYPNMYSFLWTIIGTSSALVATLVIRLPSRVGILLSVMVSFIGVLFPLMLIWIQRNLTLLNSVLFRNDQVIEQPIDLVSLASRITSEAIQFMERATIAEVPFFLVVSHLLVHSAHYPSRQFAGRSSHGPFGDVVLELDHEVGRLGRYLTSKPDLERNTFVYFTSDNGAHIEDLDGDGHVRMGGSNGLLRGGKGHGGMEGGIRVPAMVSWPGGGIEGGGVVSTPTSHLDLLPTLMEVTRQSMPKKLLLDGNSILSLLRRHSRNSSSSLKIGDESRVLFHYCGSYLHAVRIIDSPLDGEAHTWKVYFRMPAYRDPRDERCPPFMCQCHGDNSRLVEPPLVYDLTADEWERRPVDPTRDSLLHAQLVARAREAISSHEATLDGSIESQMTVSKIIWRPDLQPCCGPYPFPLCGCAEGLKDESGESRDEKYFL